jgi:hypothetical protein
MPAHLLTMAIQALLGMLPVLYGVAALALVCVAVRRVRRVVVATLRFTRAHCPRWLAPLLAVCLAIPGPIDEAVVLVIGLAVILRTSRNRATYARYMRVAWNG